MLYREGHWGWEAEGEAWKAGAGVMLWMVGGEGHRTGGCSGGAGAAQCGKKFLGNSEASWAPAKTGVSPNNC